MKRRSNLCPVLLLFLWWNLPAPLFSSPSASLNYGFHLYYGAFDFRAYQKTGSVSFDKLSSVSDFQDFSSFFKTPVWSFSFDSSKYAKTPLTLKFQIGDLSYSGALSKLKNPPLSSSISYFSQSPALSSDLGVTNPTSSSSSKTKSTALTIKSKNLKLSFSADFEGFIKSSVSYTAHPKDFMTLSFLFCYADFDLISKPQTSWRLSAPVFISDTKTALWSEILLSIPLFRTKIGLGALENPFGTIRLYGTCDMLFHYAFFSLTVSGFLSDSAFVEFPSPVYSISQSKNSVRWQLKANPAFDFSINRLHIKTGISALYENSTRNSKTQGSLYETQSPFTQTLHLTAGISLIGEKNRFSLQYRLTNIDLTDFTLMSPGLTYSTDEKLKHSFSLKYTRRFKPLSLGVSLSASAEPKHLAEKSAFSQTLTAYVYPHKFPVKSASFGVTLDEKNSTVKPSFSTAISAEYSTKNLKITGKIGVTGSLVVE